MELRVVPLNGLRVDSMGAYLASLGLFSVTTRKWPRIRACWRDACFCLVGGPASLDDVIELVGEVGENNTWTDYSRPWDPDKKSDVKKKTSVRTAVWRAQKADEAELLSFGAHLALDGRIRMNPLLGTGGNAGRRDFQKGWASAVKTIQHLPNGYDRDTLNRDLKALLSGGACKYLGSFKAGSWFGAANKIYNHGTRKPFREGQITPWAMVLACEGLSYFSGGTSRQLGSRRQPRGAFPFVTEAMPPRAEREAGAVEAEVWLPIWDQPMAEPEMRSLFLRGRAEIGGRGTTSAAAFSVGVMGRGVDASVAEFRRFFLLHTTSAQTFESRLANVVPVPRSAESDATTRAVRTVLEFCGALPKDRKVGNHWRFVGLRGPLEQALVDFAANSGGERVERAWALVDEMFKAAAKVDRNRGFRKRRPRVRLLPVGWATELFESEAPNRETRLALAISSIAETPTCPQFIAYRVGIAAERGQRWIFPETVPSRRIWSECELTKNLCAMAERRVVETLKQTHSIPPFKAAISVSINDIAAWLAGDVDEGRVESWLDRLCLFDWNGNREAALRLQDNFRDDRPPTDGALALYGFLRPLASAWLFERVLADNGIPLQHTPTCRHFGRVMAMLRRGDLSAAVEVARAAYRAAGVALADFGDITTGLDPDRLLAALVIPVRDHQVLPVFSRWRMPTKPTD